MIFSPCESIHVTAPPLQPHVQVSICTGVSSTAPQTAMIKILAPLNCVFVNVQPASTSHSHANCTHCQCLPATCVRHCRGSRSETQSIRFLPSTQAEVKQPSCHNNMLAFNVSANHRCVQMFSTYHININICQIALRLHMYELIFIAHGGMTSACCQARKSAEAAVQDSV